MPPSRLAAVEAAARQWRGGLMNVVALDLQEWWRWRVAEGSRTLASRRSTRS